ncbi:MAG TPA: hypothetical protein VNW97_00515 [Candidatus Saccharimonadales bacterium]|jgi:hypothetical protein|nr:hypothetical protein [Candidatus Saccharimonadales bacterium]
MKKLFTLAAVTLLAASVSDAQSTTGGTQQTPAKTTNKATAVRTGAQAAKPGDKVSLSPQPLPPKEAFGQRTSAGSKVSLSPQPLPPRTGDTRMKNSQGRGDRVSLNPQPLPPKEALGQKSSASSKVSLNPQPLPPRTGGTGMKNSQAGRVALNPQPEPPGAARKDKDKGKKK